MPAYKDKAKGTWYASFYFENWTGKKEKKMKRGFKTKREALEWERTFLQQQTADLDTTRQSPHRQAGATSRASRPPL